MDKGRLYLVALAAPAASAGAPVGAFRDRCLVSEAIMTAIAIAALLRMVPARRPLSEATR